jgi:glycosyltransferase involved in cell wall biosynthesis
MRLSLILACLNARPLLLRCLESIARQDHRDVELVVADGGSTDGTVGLLAGWKAEPVTSYQWFSGPDRGIADAWNKAVARVSGEWVLFLGADDVLAAPTTLSRAARRLGTLPARRLGALPARARVAYGQVALVDVRGERVDLLERPWSPADFRGCRYNLPHQAVFHHRSLFAEFGPFDEDFRIAADFDFLLRVLAHDEPAYLPGLTVTHMQVGGLSSTRRNAPAVVREEIRLYRRHVGGVPWVLLWWLVKAWAKAGLHNLGGDRLALPVTNIYRRLVRGQAPLRY